MAVVNFASQIDNSTEILKKFRKNKSLFDKEEEILELIKTRCNLYGSQIHNYLAPQKKEKAEQEIQSRVKEIFAYDLPICEIKIKRFEQALEVYESAEETDKINLCYKYLNEWLVLYEKNYALVSFRSLEHFALFMEWDKAEQDKVWTISVDPYGDGGYTGVNKPFFYYFTRMVLKKDIKFISKQMFTGGGKSYSNQFAIAWLLGIDENNDVLDVLGNPTLVLTNARGIVNIMTNPRFAMVFPKFQKYFEEDGDVARNMFSVCRLKEGELTLADSNKTLNVKIISKDTSIDGIRVKYLFLDDVCRSKDANNLRQHQIDIGNFWNSWYKRNYNTSDFYIVISGTAYNVNDIMSHLIAYYTKGKMKRTDEFKYAYKNDDGSSVIIKIPKIDTELNRSTFPQKFTYEEAVKARDRDYNTFMAMEQQQPQNPETSPLCYEKISTYEELPSGLSEGAFACLDPARTGKNYVTMGIHRIKREIDKYNIMVEKHYLVDCIFELKQMENVYGEICDKVARHHIIRLHIENNTDTSLKYLLEKMLHERGIFFCEISEAFSTENKEEKIRELVYSMEGYFKNQLVYPAMNLYAPSSQMGKFMLYLTSYDYYQKMEYDDSIDEECMYIEKFIQKSDGSTKPTILYV